MPTAYFLYFRCHSTEYVNYIPTFSEEGFDAIHQGLLWTGYNEIHLADLLLKRGVELRTVIHLMP
jgi:hypothetical protein